ncbi:UDP-N-acetylmuramate dehydrogenase [Candidatus Peregrinibacteria bacterium]|nr:UDP-N-acetylmuramate dehydrogenase [Candidatus Peregrinibacteria bacterium]
MDLQVKENISLREFTTFRTGGPAKYFAEAKTAQEMHYLREFAVKRQIPFVILGMGSNVLFLDEGYPGLIIHNKMSRMQIQGDRVTVEGGVNLTKMILIAAQHNLGGLSGLANIPGTVGGAVYGNAGIPDVCISDVLTHAVILPGHGDKPVIVGPEYFQFGYRHSKLKKNKDIVLSATLKMRMEPSVKIRAEIGQYIRERAAKQPVGNTCGSFFKNPSQFPSAGWLIDQAGCKGMQEGDAIVSPKHANFIINTGNAASKDILTLALKIHQKVKDKFNVNMEPEVQILPLSPF